MTHRLAGFALLALLATGQPSAAQTPAPDGPSAADRSALVTCLREAGRQAQGCIGGIAIACVGAASSRDAETGCARREIAVWRERLNVVAEAVLRQFDAGRRARFAALQREWEGYTAQKCAFYGELQTPARAAGMQAGCELRELGQRAIEVERLLARGTSRPSSQPPRIIR